MSEPDTRRAELAIVRRAYAKQVLFAAGVSGASALEAAFAAVPRERFLGPGPWLLRRWGRYVRTPDADPVYIYSNDPVEIDLDRQINNGQPSLHALLMAHAAPAAGEHVVHVGAGLGYYSAILARLVGPSGRVTAIEHEVDLAARARANLARNPAVEVHAGNALDVPFAPADVIYVSTGVTRPPDAWLDRLADGGRMILPMTTDLAYRPGRPRSVERTGAVFRIARQGNDYGARWIARVEIFPAAGIREDEEERALAEALDRESPEKVTRLYRGAGIPTGPSCWLRGDTWCLAGDPQSGAG